MQSASPASHIDSLPHNQHGKLLCGNDFFCYDNSTTTPFQNIKYFNKKVTTNLNTEF